MKDEKEITPAIDTPVVSEPVVIIEPIVEPVIVAPVETPAPVVEPVIEPTVEPEQKRGRGRPRKEPNTGSLFESKPVTPKKPASPVAKPTNKDKDDFFKDVEGYKATGATAPAPEPPKVDPATGKVITPIAPIAKPISVNAAAFITGALFLTIVDALLPSAIIYIAGLVSEDYKALKPKQIKLSKEQKADLAPLADEVVKIVLGEADPLFLLLIAMSAMYWENIQDAEPLPVKKK